MAVLATFPRLYVADLDQAIAALAAAGVAGVRVRFGHPSGLELAVVGDVLVLAGDDDVLAPFRATDLTLVVDDLDEALRDVTAAGAVITRDPAQQAVGRNVTVAFPGGPVLEFVEWDAETRWTAGLTGPDDPI